MIKLIDVLSQGIIIEEYKKKAERSVWYLIEILEKMLVWEEQREEFKKKMRKQQVDRQMREKRRVESR